MADNRIAKRIFISALIFYNSNIGEIIIFADMTKESFAEMGRVAAIGKLFGGIDPDAGKTRNSAHRLFLEGIDFNLEYFPLKHLGYKVVVEVTGILYASLRKSERLSLVLGVSSKLDFKQIEEFWSGVRVAVQEFGYSHTDLDLVPSLNGLCISVTADGEMVGDGFAKAASMDVLCVSGSLGSAFFGQQVLENKPSELEKYKMMVADYLKPELRADAPRQIVASGIVPTAGCFVDRGLSDAILRMAVETGLGAKVYADKIPFEGNSFSLGQELGIDTVSAAMNGGDDCRLLFAIPILQAEKFRREFQTFDIIGHLALPEAGAVLVTPEGVELPLRAQGWPNEQ